MMFAYKTAFKFTALMAQMSDTELTKTILFYIWTDFVVCVSHQWSLLKL